MKLTLQKIRTIALSLSVLVLVGGLGYFLGDNQVRSVADVVRVFNPKENATPVGQRIDRSQSGSKNINMDQFWLVWDTLENEYLFDEKIDYQKMVYGAISGMTSALGDPYTVFLPPAKNKITKENLNGSFYGVGIQLGYKLGDQLAVIAPIAGMPAEAAGVKSGDYILKIVDDAKEVDVETHGMSLVEAVELIRGEKETTVKLTLLHEGGSETFEVELARTEIVVPSVEVEFGQVINSTFTTEATGSSELVAHLTLTKFGENSYGEWDTAVAAILERKSEIAGVVLDLRNNPGGYLQGAVNLSGEFLEFGKVVVLQESSQLPTSQLTVERSGRLLDMPLVVLVNQGSASASEIMSAALKENGRAKVVGTTTFGKGTVQADEGFEDGSSLHVTIAQWLTPEGNWIHEKGITPDVEVEFDRENPTVDNQLVRAVAVLVER